jgi:hypothetical protein
LTLTGTTPAVSTNTYLSIRSITKSATTVGRVTGTSNSGAVTVCVMSSADMDYKINILRLHEIPANAGTFNVPYVIRPYSLVNDNDAPVIQCAEIIEYGATAQAWRYKRQFQKAAEYERLFESNIIRMIWDMENQLNQTHLFNPKTTDRDNY